MIFLYSFLALHCFAVSSVFSQNYDALQRIQDLQLYLPTPVAFWPLNWLFTYRDAGPNAIHGNFTSTGLQLVNGPIGNRANSAYQFHVANNFSYMEIKSPLVDFQNRSWTLSMFVNSAGVQGAMAEWRVNPSTAGGVFWQWMGNDRIYFNPQLTTATAFPCSFSSWQFAAVSFDNITLTYKLFCNNTAVGSAAVPRGPPTGSIINVGVRMAPSTPVSNPQNRYACISLYPVALSESQLSTVKALCDAYQSLFINTC